MRNSLLYFCLSLVLLFSGCSYREVQLHEFEPAFRNPMKGLRDYYDPVALNQRRAEYPEPFGSMIKEYMQWRNMEQVESDGVEKVIAYSNHRWVDVEKQNIKVIPRAYIVWVEPWHGYGFPDPSKGPDQMSGQHWPDDIPPESGPYKNTPGTFGCHVEARDSLTPITGGYFDPDFPRRVEKFVKKLGEAWDNDPRVAYVEMGIIGEWGEHHDPDITTFWPPHDEPNHVENRTWIPGIDKVLGDAFSKYFKNKKVMVRYAYDFPDYEFGIYWDSWSIDEEIERGYNQMRALGDRWKTQVIGGEITWGWGSLALKKLRGFPACIADSATHALMVEQIRNLHCNHLGGVTWTNFNDPEVMKNVQDIQKALGYRYVIDKARYGKRISIGKKWKLEFDVTNTGSSPFYYQWPVQVALLDPDTHDVVWKTCLDDVDIRTWLPGDNYDPAQGKYLDPAPVNRVKAEIAVDNVPEGEYVVALSILDPAGMLPSVRFANVEAYEGGYTVLGTVGVGCNPGPLKDNNWFDLRDERSLHYILNYENH